VWEMLLAVQPGPYEDPRYFKPEVVSTLEKRLLQDMQADKDDDDGGGGEIEKEFHKGADDSKSAPKKGKGKRGAQGVAKNGMKRTKVESLRKGKQVRWGNREWGNL
jgi:hypothetical protein